jgi:hypothetical protein
MRRHEVPAERDAGTQQRKELERQGRYTKRPTLADARHKWNDAGNVVLQLKSSRRDGTTRIIRDRPEEGLNWCLRPLAAARCGDNSAPSLPSRRCRDLGRAQPEGDP